MNSLIHPHHHASVVLKHHVFIPLTVPQVQGGSIGFANIDNGNTTKSINKIRGISSNAFRPEPETAAIGKYLDKIKPIVKTNGPVKLGGKLKPRENIKMIF